MTNWKKDDSEINKILMKIFEVILTSAFNEIIQVLKMIRDFRNSANTNKVYFVLCTCEYMQSKCECFKWIFIDFLISLIFNIEFEKSVKCVWFLMIFQFRLTSKGNF